MKKKSSVPCHIICGGRWDCLNVNKKGCRSMEVSSCKLYKVFEDGFLKKPKKKK